MKSKYVLIAFVLFCCSCQELIMKNRPFPAVDAGRIEIVPISEEKGEIIKVTNEIGENIPASKLIEDFFYVPLESIEESLFAYCNQIEVFEDKIFVFDRTGTGLLLNFLNLDHLLLIEKKSKLLFMTIRNGSGCIFL